jgi:allantoin racemase
MTTASDEEKYLRAAQSALEEDMAEVIVLGCAGMTGLDKRLAENSERLFWMESHVH